MKDMATEKNDPQRGTGMRPRHDAASRILRNVPEIDIDLSSYDPWKEIESTLTSRNIVPGTIEDHFLTASILLREIDESPYEGDLNTQALQSAGLVPLLVEEVEGKKRLFIGINGGDFTSKENVDPTQIDQATQSLTTLLTGEDFYEKIGVVMPQKTFFQFSSYVTDNEARQKQLGQISNEMQTSEILTTIINQAAMKDASDIHCEPTPTQEGRPSMVRVRYRVDGVLETANIRMSNEILSRFVSHVKGKCGLNITEKRHPQDGQFRFTDEEGAQGLTKLNYRVSTLPEVNGEKLVMRLLSVDTDHFTIENLGLGETEQPKLERVLGQRQGLVLSTGPTGSGKTTTLYTMLNQLNDPSRSIMTSENPVEIYFEGITQSQVDETIGYVYSEILRAQLRQDPDVIMIGEIRDAETAKIAVEAAQTGHLVLSTLHTTSAMLAVPRLRVLGVDDSYIAESLLAVFDQRLVRKLTSDKVSYDAGDELSELMGETAPQGDVQLFKPGENGYSRRVLLPEIWIPGKDELQLIREGNTNPEEYMPFAIERGFCSKSSQWCAISIRRDNKFRRD